MTNGARKEQPLLAVADAQEAILAREIVGGAADELARERGELLHGMGEDGEGKANRFERVEPVVGDHQRDRDDREER